MAISALYKLFARKPSAATEWTVVPATTREIDDVVRHCRRLVSRRALVAAGAAAVPLPAAVGEAEPPVVEDDVDPQAASTGAESAAMPPAIRKRRRSNPAPAGADVFFVAIETEVPLSLFLLNEPARDHAPVVT